MTSSHDASSGSVGQRLYGFRYFASKAFVWCTTHFVRSGFPIIAKETPEAIADDSLKKTDNVTVQRGRAIDVPLVNGRLADSAATDGSPILPRV